MANIREDVNEGCEERDHFRKIRACIGVVWIGWKRRMDRLGQFEVDD